MFEINGVALELVYSCYADGNTAVCARVAATGEPYAVLSINVRPLPPRRFVWNHDVPLDVLEALETLGFVERTGETLDYGYVQNQPICNLTQRGLDTATRAGQQRPSRESTLVDSLREVDCGDTE